MGLRWPKWGLNGPGAADLMAYTRRGTALSLQLVHRGDESPLYGGILIGLREFGGKTGRRRGA